MSELKAYCPYATRDGFYHKSEVDKVIAENDAAIAELKEQVHDYAQGLYVMQARAEMELRHSNRKRCLAMAKWCEAKYDAEDSKVNDGLSWEFISPEMKYWERWRWRWLELAEQFKEGK